MKILLSEEQAGVRAPLWLYVLGGALVIWNVWALLASTALSFGGLVISWLLSWALCNYFLGRVFRTLELPRWLVLVAAASLILLVLADIDRYSKRFGNRQGIVLAMERLPDKLRLESVPSIAPANVVASQPQSFHVYAPDALEVSVRFADTDSLAAVPFGDGYFRLDYDPRRDGPPSADLELIVDGQTFVRTIRLVDIPAHPRWIASSEELGIAASVSEETDELVVFDRLGAHRVLATGDGPTDVLLLDSTSALVSHRYDPSAWLIDFESGEVLHKFAVGPGQLRLALSPDKTEVAVSVDGHQPRIVRLDISGRTIIENIKIDRYADWLSYDSEGEFIVHSDRMNRTLERLDLVEGHARSIVDPLKLGRPVVAMTRRASSGRVVAAITGFDSEGIGPLGNHYVEDQLLHINIADWSIERQELTARSSDKQRRPAEVRYGGSPMGLAFDSDDGLLVAFAGTDDIWRYFDDRLPERILERESIAELWAPHGVAALGDGVIAVSSPAQGTIGLFSADGSSRGKIQVAPDDAALTREQRSARHGERGFYETARRGLSCQSCHMYGETDHALHNINGAEFSGETRRLAALTLRGISDTAPYLRDASYNTVGSLIAVAERRYDGYVRNGGNRSADLDAYAETLVLRPNPRSLTGRDEGLEREGFAAFMKAQCADCHTPPAFTNLSQHLPASLFPEYGHESEPDELLDTPALLGMWTKYPYLQDGRAESLESVFTDYNDDNLHGNTASLSEAELEALVYFLESL